MCRCSKVIATSFCLRFRDTTNLERWSPLNCRESSIGYGRHKRAVLIKVGAWLLLPNSLQECRKITRQDGLAEPWLGIVIGARIDPRGEESVLKLLRGLIDAALPIGTLNAQYWRHYLATIFRFIQCLTRSTTRLLSKSGRRVREGRQRYRKNFALIHHAQLFYSHPNYRAASGARTSWKHTRFFRRFRA